MLFASPAGIGVASQQSVHVASDRQTNIVSGQSTFITSGKSLIAAVTEKISLFVQNAGMKLFSAKGRIEIQAHMGEIELTAQKTVKVLSATESVEIAAKQEVLLTSGGAYIRMGSGNIEIHAPGKIDFKGGAHNFSGPTQAHYPLPHLPINHLFDRPVWVVDDRGFSIPDRPIRVHLKNGKVVTGKTDHDGIAQLAISDQADILRIEILKKLSGKNI